jgi:hypothetical protein
MKRSPYARLQGSAVSVHCNNGSRGTAIPRNHLSVNLNIAGAPVNDESTNHFSHLLSIARGFPDMAKIPVPPPLNIPLITRLPPNPLLPTESFSSRVGMATLRRIGAVAVAWAKLENVLSDLIWTIHGKDLSSGRISTQELQITKLLAELQKAMEGHLKGDKYKPERKAISNLIELINKMKEERNLIIHGSWAEMDGKTLVGSLRSDTPDVSLVTYDHFPTKRLIEAEMAAIQANQNAAALIARLEASRGTPSQPPRPG